MREWVHVCLFPTVTTISSQIRPFSLSHSSLPPLSYPVPFPPSQIPHSPSLLYQPPFFLFPLLSPFSLSLPSLLFLSQTDLQPAPRTGLSAVSTESTRHFPSESWLATVYYSEISLCDNTGSRCRSQPPTTLGWFLLFLFCSRFSSSWYFPLRFFFLFLFLSFIILYFILFILPTYSPPPSPPSPFPFPLPIVLFPPPVLLSCLISSSVSVFDVSLFFLSS